jgi:N-acetylglucosamine kinase-like BadF-type ATPase
MENPESNLGLGIDAGGTQTRWALAAPGGRILA